MREAESLFHVDFRRGEDEEMGWERKVGGAAPWPPEMMLADGEKREIEGERVGGGGSLGVKGVECLYIYMCENYH